MNRQTDRRAELLYQYRALHSLACGRAIEIFIIIQGLWLPVFATADEITVYPFRDSVSTEDRIFRHDSTRSPEHRIVQPEGLSKTGLEVDQKNDPADWQSLR